MRMVDGHVPPVVATSSSETASARPGAGGRDRTPRARRTANLASAVSPQRRIPPPADTAAGLRRRLESRSHHPAQDDHHRRRPPGVERDVPLLEYVASARPKRFEYVRALDLKPSPAHDQCLDDAYCRDVLGEHVTNACCDYSSLYKRIKRGQRRFRGGRHVAVGLLRRRRRADGAVVARRARDRCVGALAQAGLSPPTRLLWRSPGTPAVVPVSVQRHPTPIRTWWM